MTTTIEAAAPAARGSRGATSRRVLLFVVAVGLGVAALLIVVGTASSNGHAQLHGGTGTALLLIAAALGWRSAPAGLIAAVPAIGLTAFAVPMLIEGVGALGYDPLTQARTSDLASLHDVGLATTSLGMLVLVVAIAVSVGMLLARRTGLPRPVVAAAAVTIGIVGTLAIRVLVAGM
ncbi:MAG TPA: hypothetical protein VGK16_04565 [Candidatus Limnocylindrales bacterium]